MRWRAIKPARAAFDALAAALGRRRASASGTSGDNARGDVGGALAAGLRAVWFDWEGLAVPGRRRRRRRLRIGALRELETLAENGERLHNSLMGTLTITGGTLRSRRVSTPPGRACDRHPRA